MPAENRVVLQRGIDATTVKQFRRATPADLQKWLLYIDLVEWDGHCGHDGCDLCTPGKTNYFLYCGSSHDKDGGYFRLGTYERAKFYADLGFHYSSAVGRHMEIALKSGATMNTRVVCTFDPATTDSKFVQLAEGMLVDLTRSLDYNLSEEKCQSRNQNVVFSSAVKQGSLDAAGEVAPSTVYHGLNHAHPLAQGYKDASRAKRPEYPCRHEGCSEVAQTKAEYHAHRKACVFRASGQTVKSGRSGGAMPVTPLVPSGPSGFPKQCPRHEECGVETMFDTPGKLRYHENTAHDEWPSDRCHIAGCKSKTVFPSRQSLWTHLTVVHLLDADEVKARLDAILPATYQAAFGTSKAYVKSRCLFPGCSRGTTEFEDYNAYTQHLTRVHKVKAEDYGQYLPTPETAKVNDHPDVDFDARKRYNFATGTQRCTYPGCAKPDFVFANRGAYNGHLSKQHGVQTPDRVYWMSGDEIIPFIATACLVPGCESKQYIFTSHELWSAHMKTQHRAIPVKDRPKYSVWSVHHYGLPE